MNSKSLGLVIFNTVTLIVMLFINYASNTGIIGNASVADISHKYDTLIAPAGYAFLIWSIIFLQLISFVIYEWVLLKKNDPEKIISKTGIWFGVGNIANTAWIYAWLNEKTGWSVLIIFILLLSLIMLTKKLRLELDDEPVKNILFVWWPIAIYLGWIMIATIACTASWLFFIHWEGFGLSQNIWTIIMMAAAFILYLLLIRRRNMRETAIVGAWAFIAIAVRWWHVHEDIKIAAVVFALFLFIASGLHGYKNRIYGVGNKLKKGEW